MLKGAILLAGVLFAGLSVAATAQEAPIREELVFGRPAPEAAPRCFDLIVVGDLLAQTHVETPPPIDADGVRRTYWYALYESSVRVRRVVAGQENHRIITTLNWQHVGINLSRPRRFDLVLKQLPDGRYDTIQMTEPSARRPSPVPACSPDYRAGIDIPAPRG